MILMSRGFLKNPFLSTMAKVLSWRYLRKSLAKTLEKSLLCVLIFLSLSFRKAYILRALIRISKYIFHFELALLLVHLSNFLSFGFFFKLQFLLSILHDVEFFLLEDFHSADFQDSPTEDVEEGFDFVVKIKEFIVPDLGLSELGKNITHRRYFVAEVFCA